MPRVVAAIAPKAEFFYKEWIVAVFPKARIHLLLAYLIAGAFAFYCRGSLVAAFG